jgi:hypothetical protein
MGDKYYRLIIFSANICPQPVRQLFLKCMKADTKRPVSTLGNYLSARYSELFSLKTKKLINPDQWDLLFPKSSQPDVTKWDITLLKMLIDKLFPKHLSQTEVFSLNEIRCIRNKCFHEAKPSISDLEFDDLWTRLETATVYLAKQISPPQYEHDIKKTIDNAKINNMPDLGDALRIMHAEQNIKINRIEENTERMTERTEENYRQTVEIHKILKDSSVQKVGPCGKMFSVLFFLFL